MRSVTILTVFICLALCLAAFGVNTSYPTAAGVTATKTIKQPLTPTAKPLVTFALTNKSAQPLNAVFYSDHLPSGVSVKPLGVTVNGVTALIMPTKSSAGAICPKMISHTWTVQPLTKYGTTNTIKAYSGQLVVTYELTFPANGSYFLEGYSWAGKLGPKTGAASNVVFGYASGQNHSGIRERITGVSRAQSGLSLVSGSKGAYLFSYNPGAANEVADLRIVSPTGQLVQTVRAFSGTSAGYRFVWDGRNSSGHPVSAGTYLLQAAGGGQSAVRRLVILR